MGDSIQIDSRQTPHLTEGASGAEDVGLCHHRADHLALTGLYHDCTINV